MFLQNQSRLNISKYNNIIYTKNHMLNHITYKYNANVTTTYKIYTIHRSGSISYSSMSSISELSSEFEYNSSDESCASLNSAASNDSFAAMLHDLINKEKSHETGFSPIYEEEEDNNNNVPPPLPKPQSLSPEFKPILAGHHHTRNITSIMTPMPKTKKKMKTKQQQRKKSHRRSRTSLVMPSSLSQALELFKKEIGNDPKDMYQFLCFCKQKNLAFKYTQIRTWWNSDQQKKYRKISTQIKKKKLKKLKKKTIIKTSKIN